MGCQVSRFLCAMLGQIVFGMGLAGPVLVDVLAEPVDHGEHCVEVFGKGEGRFAAGAEIRDFVVVLGPRMIDVDGNSGHVGRIDAAIASRLKTAGGGSHSAKTLGQSFRKPGGNSHLEDLFLARRDGGRFDATALPLGSVGIRVVDTEMHAHGAAADVFHAGRHVGHARQIPASGSRPKCDAGPLVAAVYVDPHLGAVALDAGVGRRLGAGQDGGTGEGRCRIRRQGRGSHCGNRKHQREQEREVISFHGRPRRQGGRSATSVWLAAYSIASG